MLKYKQNFLMKYYEIDLVYAYINELLCCTKMLTKILNMNV